MKPTDRQLAIHAWMLAFQAEHSMPPTMREIAEHFGWVSNKATFDHLRAMKKHGLVRHTPFISRGWGALQHPVQAPEVTP